MRCTHCPNGDLERSGQEPHRYVCSACGQNFFLVMRLEPVAAVVRSHLELPGAR